MNALSSLSITDIERPAGAEPRILDLRLAEALGFAQPRDIRKIIDRHKAAIERLGKVCATVAQTSRKGGRPSKEYHLNKKQAIYIAGKSETPNAVDITLHVIEVFDAVTSGHLPPPSAHVTPEQAGELFTLLSERFPDGADRPYAWSRFNHHFRIARYRELPAARFAEACAYIRTIPLNTAPKALPPPADAMADRYLTTRTANGGWKHIPIGSGAKLVSCSDMGLAEFVTSLDGRKLAYLAFALAHRFSVLGGEAAAMERPGAALQFGGAA